MATVPYDHIEASTKVYVGGTLAFNVGDPIPLPTADTLGIVYAEEDIHSGSVDGSPTPAYGFVTQSELAAALKVPGVEGVPVYAYGHSFNLSTGGQSSVDSVWPQRLKNRLRMGALTNRAVSGLEATHTGDTVISGASGWVPGTKGVVTLDVGINDIRLYGTNAGAVAAFEDEVTALLRVLTAASKVESTHASVVTSGTSWALFGDGSPGTRVSGDQTRWCQTVGDYADITFTGDAITIGTLRLKTGVTGGTFAIKNGGTTLATFACGGGARSLPATAVPSWNHASVHISGLGPGAHTLRFECTVAGPVYFDYYLLPSTTPPTIVVVKDRPLPAWTGGNNAAPYNQGSDAAVDAYAAAIDAAVAQLGNPDHVVIAEPAPWDPAAMICSDGVHPNDAGMAAYADSVGRALAGVGFRVGMNVP